jgi:membrane-associated phospholipid phosphatase
MTTHRTPAARDPNSPQVQAGPVRRLSVLLVALAVGLSTVVALAPGGLGDANPVLVTDGASVSAYRWLVERDADLPTWAHGVVEKGAAGGLVVLAGLLVLAWWPRRRDPAAFATAVLTGAATLAAYVTSEALKLIVDEERPCRALIGLAPAADCPPPGDWSFPSNHATLAAALAVGIVFVRPRIGVIAVLVAGVVAVLRVLTGVHYPHDVLAGLALGGVMAAVVVLMLTPATAWLVTRLGRGRRSIRPHGR